MASDLGALLIPVEMKWTVDGKRTSGKVAILVLVARLVGKLIGKLTRTQTRILSRAQFHGWIPTDHEAAKLMRRQTVLFNWRMARKALKKFGRVENKG